MDPDTLAPDTGRPKWHNQYHVEVLLVSFSALLIEISYTRVISYKLFYYYVYLVIGLALLGIGAGGVFVAVSKRLRNTSIDLILFWSFLLGAIATVVAYVFIAFTRLDTLAIWRYGTHASYKSLASLLFLCFCLFISFVPAGVITATLFSRRPKAIGGLYFADLLGAGIACAVVIYVISSLGAPAAIMLAASVMAAGAVLAARRLNASLMAVASVMAIVGVVLTIGPGFLPAQRLDSIKTPIAKGTLIYSGWGSVLRVDVATAPGFPNLLLLYHDGIFGASIDRWNGTEAFLKQYDFPQDPRSFPFRVLGTPPRREAVIGAAGGHEVLTSLFYGAKHVDAVELNPLTVQLVTTRFANFDGHLAQNPRVSYINADGRSYMARSNQHYNLVWYPAPDSYAATDGGLSSAYVLSEAYLYTTNGVQSMLQHLTKHGIFTAQFGEFDRVHDLRTTRFVATARQALANLGVSDPSNHILVASTPSGSFFVPLSTILVSRSAFTPTQIRRFLAAVKAVPHSVVLSVGGRGTASNPVNELLRTPASQLNSFYSSFPYNIAPTTDNDPFFYHFNRFSTVIANFFHPLDSTNRENAAGERVLLLLLVLSILAAALLLLLPFAAIRSVWVKMPRKGLSTVFFSGVGLGFIFFEITLIQLLNLFLGFPTYSLTITLTSLLVFTGLGSLASQRVRRRRQAIPALLVVLVGLFAFYLFGLTPLTNALFGLPLVGRIVATFLVLAPLGLCLGMFTPIGLGEISQLGEYPRQYVAWGWAVSGFASVVGSSLATILAMSYGFDFVLTLGLLCYVVAVAAFVGLSRRDRVLA